MPVPPFTADGQLPVGRHPFTLDEVHATFVSGMAAADEYRREAIWSDWQAAHAFLRRKVPVVHAWLGGSFVSTKKNPGDLDVVFLVDGDAYERLDDEVRAAVMPFAMGSAGRDFHGLSLIDSFVVPWSSVLKPAGRGDDDRADGYYWARGKWDDLWQRSKPLSDREADQVAAVRPSRGYMEVTFDE